MHPAPSPTPSDRPGAGSARERWSQEAAARAAQATIDPDAHLSAPVVMVADTPEAGPPHVPDGWLEALRADVADAIAQIPEAIDGFRTTVDREIEAMRSANREEAKRLRASGGEELVRTRVATTEELARIRASIEAGVDRLCRVVDGELDKMWSANDRELERIRSIGTDRLVEVHDLLTEQLGRLRASGPLEPVSAEPPVSGRRWRRSRAAQD